MKLALLNTHLESTADYAQERMRQLNIIFNRMNNIEDSRNVIIAGDFNLRDKEVYPICPIRNCVIIRHFLVKL